MTQKTESIFSDTEKILFVNIYSNEVRVSGVYEAASEALRVLSDSFLEIDSEKYEALCEIDPIDALREVLK